MGTMKLQVAPGAEARRFDSAFYRFLESHSGAIESAACCSLHTLPQGETELKIVTLWSNGAIDSFAQFWRGHRPKRAMLGA